MSYPTSPYVLRSPQDALAMLPYLLGFHPSDSLVALFADSLGRQQGVFRVDRAVPPAETIRTLRESALRHGADNVVLVGYGPRHVRSLVQQVAAAVTDHVCAVYCLLVTEGQYFCVNPGCSCAASEGVAFDPAATAIAAQATVDGMVALPSREEFLAQVLPDSAAQAATSAAMTPQVFSRRFAKVLLRSSLEAAQSGVRLTDKQVASLARALETDSTQADAWQETRDLPWQRTLWLDMTRRTPDGHVAAPASLAAWCTWLRGENALALVAAKRALSADPAHRMANLIVDGITSGVPARDVMDSWPFPRP